MDRRISDEMADRFEEPLTICDGFDEAIVGVVEVHTRKPIVVYDPRRMVEILVERDGMTEGEAEEYLAFNTYCAWVGDSTPGFLTWRPGDDE